MTKAFFMDIDGPMIPSKAYYLPNQTKPASVFDPCAVAMVNRILDDDPSVRIVISSTWGDQGYNRCSNLLSANGIDYERLHEDWVTPRNTSHVRTKQIAQWLNAHPEVKQWCALDDELLDSKMLPGFVQCDTYNGMSIRNYMECRYHLGLTNPLGPGMHEHDRKRHWSTIELYKRYEIIRTTRVGEAQHAVAKATAEKLFPSIKVEDESI